MNTVERAIILDETKRYVDSQKLAKVDDHRAFVSFSDIADSDFNYGTVGFSHVSDLTPTKNQIESGTMQLLIFDNKNELTATWSLNIDNVLFDDDMVYGGTLKYTDIVTLDMYLAVAYNSGSWNGLEIPKPGIYLHKGNLADLGGNIRFCLEYETIHPIDQKFLPPVDSITMNGADGKQYKLTVSGGALNIAEVV